jgi:hypothetical protein
MTQLSVAASTQMLPVLSPFVRLLGRRRVWRSAVLK